MMSSSPPLGGGSASLPPVPNKANDSPNASNSRSKSRLKAESALERLSRNRSVTKGYTAQPPSAKKNVVA